MRIVEVEHDLFKGFHVSTTLIVIGLLLNTIASIIVLVPYLIKSVDIEDDLIIKSNRKTGRYTQRKHIKARRIGIIGFSLFVLGFLLDLIGVIVQARS